MALITTPGAPDADAYVSLADYKAYCSRMGHTFPASTGADDLIEQGIRRGTQWLDNTYRDRFPGEPTEVDQALEWPRSGVTYRGEDLPDDVIPAQIVSACCEASRREIAKPGSLAPDRKRGGKIKSVAAGSAEVVFADTAPVETTFTAIDGILAGLIGAGPGNTSVAFLARA